MRVKTLKQKETKMEPEKFNKKKMDDIFKSVFYSFTVPVTNYNFSKPIETTNEAIARMDEVDLVVDAMTSYPTAERMLNDLFKINEGKQ